MSENAFYVSYALGPLLLVFLGLGTAGTVIVGPIADRVVGPRRFML